MARGTFSEVAAWAGAVLLCGAAIQQLVARGGPYFDLPPTVMEHVSTDRHETRDALILLPQVARLIPRGATVTAFRPQGGRAQNDHANYLTAVGLLPYHFVLPPFTAHHDTARHDLAQYVVAVGEPFDHPHYEAVAGFPNGWLYKVRP